MQDKTLAFKNEKCSGGKHSKKRHSLLLAVKIFGTDKLKPFLIGKSNKPRCISSVKSIPVENTANKKAWMNYLENGYCKLTTKLKHKNAKFYC